MKEEDEDHGELAENEGQKDPGEKQTPKNLVEEEVSPKAVQKVVQSWRTPMLVGQSNISQVPRMMCSAEVVDGNP